MLHDFTKQLNHVDMGPYTVNELPLCAMEVLIQFLHFHKIVILWMGGGVRNLQWEEWAIFVPPY